MVKTFALPDIDVGSILEYTYDLKLNLKKAASTRSLSLERWKPEEGGVPDDLQPYSFTTEIWDFDAPLFTLKAEYAFIPFRSGQSYAGRDFRLLGVSIGLPWGPPVINGNAVFLSVDNIPAREKEERSAPEEAGRMGVIFFYCSSKILGASDYWDLEGVGWQNAVEKFIAVTDAIRRESEAGDGPGRQLSRQGPGALYPGPGYQEPELYERHDSGAAEGAEDQGQSQRRRCVRRTMPGSAAISPGLSSLWPEPPDSLPRWPAW